MPLTKLSGRFASIPTAWLGFTAAETRTGRTDFGLSRHFELSTLIGAQWLCRRLYLVSVPLPFTPPLP